MILHLVLQIQACLLFVLGGVLFVVQQTGLSSSSSRQMRWFVITCLMGSFGLMLHAQRGYWPVWATIVLGNLLMLLQQVCLARAVAFATRTRQHWLPWMLLPVAIAEGLLIHLAYIHPNVTQRVLVVSIVTPLLMGPSIFMLFRTKAMATRPAAWTLAVLLLVFVLGWIDTVVDILRGQLRETGATWPAVVLLAAVPLCFLWMELLRGRDELSQLAMTDPLTGLLNRRGIELIAERELARSERKRTALSLLTVDIDRFKIINDTYGHGTGDATIVAVAGVLRSSLRAQDVAVRVGGDEFVVLLTESSERVAEQVAVRIEEMVGRLRLRSRDGVSYAVSVSVGTFTMIPNTERTFEDLIHVSDMDLYRRKSLRQA
ncbi:MAG: GGDEF domain-containing protein [Acidobacteriaceae bacterium]|nr:GGDEF domain-containing protein [Acidobacteriaceae bacterium]